MQNPENACTFFNSDVSKYEFDQNFGGLHKKRAGEESALRLGSTREKLFAPYFGFTV